MPRIPRYFLPFGRRAAAPSTPAPKNIALRACGLLRAGSGAVLPSAASSHARIRARPLRRASGARQRVRRRSRDSAQARRSERARQDNIQWQSIEAAKAKDRIEGVPGRPTLSANLPLPSSATREGRTNGFGQAPVLRNPDFGKITQGWPPRHRKTLALPGEAATQMVSVCDSLAPREFCLHECHVHEWLRAVAGR
jgi:hypothetical protein